MVEGRKVRKTKTAHLVDQLENESYTRTPSPELQNLTKQETKTLMISRFGMLECGVNFKGSKPTMCSICNKSDDEVHRLNHCKRFRSMNYYDETVKPNFNDIFSSVTV